MMRATLIAFILILFSRPAFCQTANQGVTGLEACFQQARLADKICEGLSSAEQRVDCFNKTRDARLECLTHVLPDEQTTSGTTPQEMPPPKSAEGLEKSAPDRTGSTEPMTDVNSKAESPNTDANLNAPKTPAPDPAATPPQSNAPTVTEAVPAPDRWLISETTSPVDFSAMVSAVVQASEPGDKGPGSLTIRCRAKRTELSLQFSDNVASKNHRPRIYFQIDDQSAARQVWNWSADGRTAIFKDDSISFLQSLPDSTRLTIWTDDGDARSGTGFQLNGIDAVRRKVAAACSWTPQQARTSKKK